MGVPTVGLLILELVSGLFCFRAAAFGACSVEDLRVCVTGLPSGFLAGIVLDLRKVDLLGECVIEATFRDTLGAAGALGLLLMVFVVVFLLLSVPLVLGLSTGLL